MRTAEEWTAHIGGKASPYIPDMVRQIQREAAADALERGIVEINEKAHAFVWNRDDYTELLEAMVKAERSPVVICDHGKGNAPVCSECKAKAEREGGGDGD